MKKILPLITALMFSFACAEEEMGSAIAAYTAAGDFSIPFTVELENREPTEEDQWQVTLFGLEDAPMPEESVLSVAPEKDAPALYSFGPIRFNQDHIDGEYHYTLRIKGPADPLMTYDTVKTATIRVADNQDGSLNISSYAQKWIPAFKNVYYNAVGVRKMEFVQDAPDGFKADDKWTFYLSAEEGAPMPELTEISVTPAEDGLLKADFGKIAFTGKDIDRLFSYTVSSIGANGNSAGPAARAFQIRVLDNGDGTLNPIASIDETSSTPDGQDHSSVRIHGTLSINGRNFLPGDSLKISLSGEDGAPMPVWTDVSASPIFGSTVDFDFGSVRFSEEDEGKSFRYTLTAESDAVGVASAEPMVTTVEVQKNEEGILQAVAADADTMDISCSYSAESNLPVSVVKSISGREFIEGFSWIYTIQGSKGAPLPAESVVTFHEPDGGTETIVELGEICFTHEMDGKTYSYTIEESTDLGGVTAGEPVSFDVTVTDNLDGTLKLDTTLSNPEPLVFRNEYTTAGDFDFSGTLKMLNREFREGDSWKLTLSANEGAPMPEAGTIELSPSAGAEIAYSFGTVHFTGSDAGMIYRYSLETEGEVPGVDNSAAMVLDLMATDNGDGSMTISRGENELPWTIEQVYHAEGRIHLAGTVSILNREFKPGDHWEFAILAPDGAPQALQSRISFDPTEGNAGVVDFGEICFSEADIGKEYAYTISETGEISGVQCGADQTVVIRIADHGDGTLDVTLEEDADILFENIYSAEGTFSLSGGVRMKGRKLQKDETWKIRVEAEDGAPVPENTEITVVSEKGATTTSFSFESVRVSVEDSGKTYRYRIYISGGKGHPRIKNPQVFTVTVLDNGDGSLSCYMNLPKYDQ